MSLLSAGATWMLWFHSAGAERPSHHHSLKLREDASHTDWPSSFYTGFYLLKTFWNSVFFLLHFINQTAYIYIYIFLNYFAIFLHNWVKLLKKELSLLTFLAFCWWLPELSQFPCPGWGPAPWIMIQGLVHAPWHYRWLDLLRDSPTYSARIIPDQRRFKVLIAAKYI